MSFLSGSGASGSGNATVTVPASSGANARIGIFCVPFECTTAPTSITATLNGISLTLVNSTVSSTGVEGVYVFYANEATLVSIGTGSQVFASTVTGGTGLQGFQKMWAFFDGRSQSAPTSAVFNNTGTPITGSVTAAGTGADIVGAVGLNNAGVTTAGTGYTSVYIAADGGGDAQAGLEYQANVAAGSTTVAFGNTASPQWGMVAVSLEAGSSGQVLTAGSGSFALTGEVQTNNVSMAAGFGSFSMTGETAILTATGNSLMIAATGSFVISGAPSNSAFLVPASNGTYTMSGQSINLIGPPVAGAKGSLLLLGIGN